MKPRHQFVICACGDSPYLEECILSLKAQTVPADILISALRPPRECGSWPDATDCRS